MLISTKFIGEVEIAEEGIIKFKSGLPGFPELHDFVLLSVEENTTISYLQSLEEKNVCFIVMDPFLIVQDYQFDVSDEIVDELKIEKVEDLGLYVILTIPENVQDITANLMAPIIINQTNRKAVQEVLSSSEYSMKHKLFRGE